MLEAVVNPRMDNLIQLKIKMDHNQSLQQSQKSQKIKREGILVVNLNKLKQRKQPIKLPNKKLKGMAKMIS